MPFLGVRLEEPTFSAQVEVRVDVHHQESAGLVLMQNNANQLRLEVTAGAAETVVVRAVRVRYGLQEGKMHYQETVEGQLSLPAAGAYTLRISGSENNYNFAAAVAGQKLQTVASQVDGTHLGSETAEGFVGTYLGVFASANGGQTQNQALFSDFGCRYPTR